jgi:hypothetical protein
VRINPIPFLFLPGIVVIGLVMDGWSNLSWGLGAWCVVVVVGTMTHVARLFVRQHAEDDEVSNFVERTSSVVVDEPRHASAAGRRFIGK